MYHFLAHACTYVEVVGKPGRNLDIHVSGYQSRQGVNHEISVGRGVPSRPPSIDEIRGSTFSYPVTTNACVRKK
jgi:hypothetical protein